MGNGGRMHVGGNVVRWKSHMVLVTMAAMLFMFDSPVLQLYGRTMINTKLNVTATY